MCAKSLFHSRQLGPRACKRMKSFCPHQFCCLIYFMLGGNAQSTTCTWTPWPKSAMNRRDLNTKNYPSWSKLVIILVQRASGVLLSSLVVCLSSETLLDVQLTSKCIIENIPRTGHETKDTPSNDCTRTAKSQQKAPCSCNFWRTEMFMVTASDFIIRIRISA